MTVIRIILGIAIGLGVDWALFGRLKMLLWRSATDPKSNTAIFRPLDW